VNISVHLFSHIFVGPLGLEPRLFGTKNRRVASYTMGQLASANLGRKNVLTKKDLFFFQEKIKTLILKILAFFDW
jgi:hypothetical protein